MKPNLERQTGCKWYLFVVVVVVVGIVVVVVVVVVDDVGIVVERGSNCKDMLLT